MRVYISGPITGLTEEEFMNNFKFAEEFLTKRGHEVINPCTIEHDHAKTWEDYMCCDIRALFPCDAIAMIPGWENSRGARIEIAISKEMGKHIIYLNNLTEYYLAGAK